MRKNLLPFLLLTLTLSACADTETIYFQNAQGQVAQCGPYITAGGVARAIAPATSTPTIIEAQYQLRSCTEDYERRGFGRVAAPSRSAEAREILVAAYPASGPIFQKQG